MEVEVLEGKNVSCGHEDQPSYLKPVLPLRECQTLPEHRGNWEVVKGERLSNVYERSRKLGRRRHKKASKSVPWDPKYDNFAKIGNLEINKCLSFIALTEQLGG